MAIKPVLHRIALASAVLGCVPLAAQAQEGPSNWDIKFHGGLTAGNVQKDHDDNKMFGFGFQGRIPLTPFQAITFEVGYDYIGGRQMDATRFTGPVYYLATYGDPASVTSVSPTDHTTPLTLSNENSIDLRKELLEGFTVKLGYSSNLPIGEGNSWHLGVRLDDYSTHAEFTGTLIPMDPKTGQPVPGNGASPGEISGGYYEGWATQIRKTHLAPGIYAGLSFRLMDGLRLETDLRSIGYQHYTLAPFTYTGKPFAVTSSNRTGYAFEVALALNL